MHGVGITEILIRNSFTPKEEEKIGDGDGNSSLQLSSYFCLCIRDGCQRRPSVARLVLVYLVTQSSRSLSVHHVSSSALKRCILTVSFFLLAAHLLQATLPDHRGIFSLLTTVLPIAQTLPHRGPWSIATAASSACCVDPARIDDAVYRPCDAPGTRNGTVGGLSRLHV